MTFYGLLILVFIAGYGAIIAETWVRVNKTAVALGMAALSWVIFFVAQPASVDPLTEHVASAAQVLLFLLGAMMIVEIIDIHHGFRIITDLVRTSSRRKVLWLSSLVTFFLSAILDNLTTTIVMTSLLRKWIPDAKERILPLCLVVVAANSGGAWTPIGDVTTTMLWIGGQLSSVAVMKALLIPSLISLLVPLLYVSSRAKGRLTLRPDQEKPAQEPGSRLVFFLGIGGLIAVPFIKAATGLPPFMGILIVVSLLWLVTDLLHAAHEERRHLRVPHVLAKIDVAGVLFFLGILLSVAVLEVAGILPDLARFLEREVTSLPLLATGLGILSAVIDNVPLVAATMGMYPLEAFPIDAPIWHLIAYAAGTGGSLFIIGSASGIALMGLEKIDFLTYMRKMTLPVLAGYLAGIGVYLLMA